MEYEEITAKVSFSPMKINGYLTIDDIKSLHKSVKIITDLKLFRRFFLMMIFNPAIRFSEKLLSIEVTRMIPF